MKTKRCTKHKEYFPNFDDVLPANDDYFRRMSNGYLDSWCYKCKSIYNRRNRLAEEDEIKTAKCSICSDEFWVGNLVYRSVTGGVKNDYRVCGECSELLDSGALENPGIYIHTFEPTELFDCMGKGEMDDVRQTGDYSRKVDEKHKKAMEDSGLYRHLKPGDPDFDEMAKEIMGLG